MPQPSKLIIVAKAIRELGLQPLVQLASHRFKTRFGFYSQVTSSALNLPESFNIEKKFPEIVVKPAKIENVDRALTRSNDLLAGFYHPFGTGRDGEDDERDRLLFPQEENLLHWSQYRDDDPQNDLKLIWEPARFNWVADIVRSLEIAEAPSLIKVFWDSFALFNRDNPPFLGQQWISAQEVALRIIHWTLLASYLDQKGLLSITQRRDLYAAIYIHAQRLPVSVGYARSQQNNHLLSEAAGLYTAGCLLQALPYGRQWKQLGWKLFHQGIAEQIEEDGNYAQNSHNYHRVMLQLSLWMHRISTIYGDTFPQTSMDKLAKSTRYLLRKIDPISGNAPNFGHNDGSYILALTGSAYRDYRPVVQAASNLFLGKPAFPPGDWDELSNWFGLGSNQSSTPDPAPSNPTRIGSDSFWAALKVGNYCHRPAHADRLHTEIWWNGLNLVADPGTFRYTAPSPWQNALAEAPVHNALVVDGQNPMLRTGRFLWLDWYNSSVVKKDIQSITATHYGYAHIGIDYNRTLSIEGKTVQILDEIRPIKNQPKLRQFGLYWLLPDTDWTLQPDQSQLSLELPDEHQLLIQVEAVNQSAETTPISLAVYRCSQRVDTSGQDQPLFGWTSPTYNSLKPALGLHISFSAQPPFHIKTTFRLV